jgi:RNA polymerase sigma factor (TIGR02999 family)
MNQSAQHEVTLCLQQIHEGDESAIGRLVEHVYEDLRGIAGGVFQRQSSGHTLQPTVLVHEVFMRLVKPENANWSDRKHFYRAAARAMRQLLTDHARARRADKRGAGGRRVMLHENMPITEHGQGISIVALDAALEKLEALDQRQARIVELRFLGGLSVAETAEVLGVTERTVYLDWSMARTWLQRELQSDDFR